jgi:CelD/BcsL family acetyltransferase involved in cellulose biosynthesis
MNVYEIDPTRGRRWETFVDGHPLASVFHTREWLEALGKTYGYRPTAFTTSRPGSPLADGIPFCEVSGLLGKKRLVALPFSDHCAPLVDSQGKMDGLLDHLRAKVDRSNWKFLQVRSSLTETDHAQTNIRNQETYTLHKLDLLPSEDDLFSEFHVSCVQRKIRRAEREGLIYREGRSESLLRAFYHLLIKTRRRHGLPPQPLAWFRNLIASLDDKFTIRVAYKDDVPAASIVTLCHKQTMTYKYGCSDGRFSAFGGIQLLFWRAIRDAKRNGMSTLDFGRTEAGNTGLLLFKDRWGATRSSLSYFQYPADLVERKSGTMKLSMVKGLCSYAPDSVLAAAGKVLYKYAG